jgi:hypothetical protein
MYQFNCELKESGQTIIPDPWLHSEGMLQYGDDDFGYILLPAKIENNGGNVILTQSRCGVYYSRSRVISNRDRAFTVNEKISHSLVVQDTINQEDIIQHIEENIGNNRDFATLLWKSDVISSELKKIGLCLEKGFRTTETKLSILHNQIEEERAGAEQRHAELLSTIDSMRLQLEGIGNLKSIGVHEQEKIATIPSLNDTDRIVIKSKDRHVDFIRESSDSEQERSRLEASSYEISHKTGTVKLSTPVNAKRITGKKS